MIQKTIETIEAKIKESASIGDENKAELISLLGELKEEVSEFSKTHAEDAESITHFTQASTHEATKTSKNPQLLKLSVDGLSSSVEGLETSHPKLVEVVNKVAYILSNMGI
jgi:hypothetical protein